MSPSFWGRGTSKYMQIYLYMVFIWLSFFYGDISGKLISIKMEANI